MTLKVHGVCVLIQVFDMRASVLFYRDLLGFEVVDHFPSGDEWDWVRLRMNGTELMLNTANEASGRPSAPDPARAHAHADTVLYFDCPDVDQAYRHLTEHGLEVEGPLVAPYGMTQVIVSDPDGYELCFQWPTEP